MLKRGAFAAIVACMFSVPALAQCQTVAGAVCAPAGSARVGAASGSVFLSSGGNFMPVRSGAIVGPGQTIVSRSGLAQVALGNTCSTSLPANSILTITQSNGQICASRMAAPIQQANLNGSVPGAEFQGGPGGGGGFGGGPFGPGGIFGGGGGGGLGGLGLGLGLAGIAGAVGIGVAINNANNNSPISP